MYSNQFHLNKKGSRQDRLAVNPYEFGRELSQEHAPFYHTTDPNRFLPLTDCYQYIPGVGNKHIKNQGTSRQSIDIESDLRNQNRQLSYCPKEKFLPVLNCSDCESCDQGLPCSCYHCKQNLHNGNDAAECDFQIIPEHTKLNYIKPCNLPGIYINRFEPLCRNVQDPNKIHKNNYIGIDSRNFMKDKFANLVKYAKK